MLRKVRPACRECRRALAGEALRLGPAGQGSANGTVRAAGACPLVFGRQPAGGAIAVGWHGLHLRQLGAHGHEDAVANQAEAHGGQQK
jgi:hypothetical protein